MRVRERLKTEMKFFFSKYLFCILISLTRAGPLLGAERAGPGGVFEHPPV